MSDQDYRPLVERLISTKDRLYPEDLREILSAEVTDQGEGVNLLCLTMK